MSVLTTKARKEDTIKCLRSLQKVYKNLSGEGFGLNLVLIDNASSDDTAVAVRKEFPQVKIFENEKNLGFARGNNIAIKYALKQGADYVMLLNNDTLIENDVISPLFKLAESDEEIGLVAPAIKHYQKGKLFYGLEGHVDWRLGKSTHRNVKKIVSKEQWKLTSRHPEIRQSRSKDPQGDSSPRLRMTEILVSSGPIEAEFVSFCCVLIKRKVFEQVGLLDEKYYLYIEDVDYCVRASKAGYKILLEPTARLFHKTSSSFKSPLHKLPHSFKSSLIFIAKHVPWQYKLLAFAHSLFFYPYLAFLWWWQERHKLNPVEQT